MPWNYKKCQKIYFKGNWAEIRPKICFLRQSRTKDLEQNGVLQ